MSLTTILLLHSITILNYFFSYLMIILILRYFWFKFGKGWEPRLGDMFGAPKVPLYTRKLCHPLKILL